MDWMGWIQVAGLVVAVLGLALAFPAVRRWLRMEKPPPPPPYYVRRAYMDELRRDPLVAPVLPADDSRVHVVEDGQQEREIMKGSSLLLTQKGAEIRFRFGSTGGDSVLMVRPEGSAAAEPPGRRPRQRRR